jgi:uncharacterized membrane protein (UPF0127 family)
MLRSILSVLALLCVTGAVQAECRDDTVFLRGDWGSARFSVDVVKTKKEQSRGLMFVESMPQSKGMLFVYDRPTSLSFWMRNTLIELDMLFIDPFGVVQHIHHRAIPLDETPIHGGDGLVGVLEINGGLSKALGIAVGTEVRHPSFVKSLAAWPC